MKRDMLEEILRLTQLQKEALEKEDIDTYKNLTSKRKIQMDKIDVLHSESPELRADKEEDILREIIALDEANLKMFHQQLEDTKKKLSQVRSKQQARRVYNNPYNKSIEEGMYIDKR